jgi:hypothetical protein
MGQAKTGALLGQGVPQRGIVGVQGQGGLGGLAQLARGQKMVEMGVGMDDFGYAELMARQKGQNFIGIAAGVHHNGFLPGHIGHDATVTP